MLFQLLKTIQTGEVHNLQEIALSMNISQEMAIQIIEELANKGYLVEVSADCDSPKNTCSNCPVNTHCQSFIKQWVLTEKGNAAASARPSASS
jgi:hypothetical protein